MRAGGRREGGRIWGKMDHNLSISLSPLDHVCAQ